MVLSKTKAKHLLIIGIIVAIVAIILGAVVGYYAYKEWHTSHYGWWIGLMLIFGIMFVIGLILLIIGASGYASAKNRENAMGVEMSTFNSY